MEPVAEERHIKINLQGEHMMISGIHSVLEEMVYNLIENAIKYNKEDGTIDVMIKRKNIVVSFVSKIPASEFRQTSLTGYSNAFTGLIRAIPRK